MEEYDEYNEATAGQEFAQYIVHAADSVSDVLAELNDAIEAVNSIEELVDDAVAEFRTWLERAIAAQQSALELGIVE